MGATERCPREEGSSCHPGRFQLIRCEGGGPPLPVPDKRFDFFQAPNPAPRAQRETGEAGCGAAECERAWNIIAPQESVSERGMENISGSGRIDRLQVKCGGVVE